MTSKLRGWNGGRIVVTDIVTDPNGTLGTALVEKFAAKDEEVRQPRRGRPLDAVFDAALVSACQASGVRFGVNKATLALAEDIMARRYGAFEKESVRERVKMLRRHAKKFPPA